MLAFHYTITDEVGLHARPAGILVKEANKYESQITVKKDGKTADARRIMALMALGIKCGQEIEVEVSGPDEAVACEALKTFFEQNL